MPDIGCKPAVHQRPRGRFVMTEGILGPSLGKAHGARKVSKRSQSSSFVTEAILYVSRNAPQRMANTRFYL
ncbi:hypothetical protein QQF64_010947 [Cirrhinus molitorella]|uniref:Uncharacterized protein n=1 Tax=Cirrhinus molitorella TaxID=172907 RepID=A0ABR3M1Y1_9TELE